MVVTDGPFVLSVRNDPSTLKFLHDPREFTLEEFESWFIKEQPEWYIVTKENTPIGYIRLKIEKASMFMIGVDIHPDYRGYGYGKLAMKRAMTKAIVNCSLEVFEDNVLAKHIYDSLGFIEVSRKEVNGRTSIRMEYYRKSIPEIII